MRQTTRPNRISGFLLALGCCLAQVACTPPTGVKSEYEQQIVQSRVAKDVQFFNPDVTVLRPKELAEFTGLRYFPVDSAYRYVVPFQKIDDPPTVPIAKQRSGPAAYLHIGYVSIPGPDTTISLSVFWFDEMEPLTGWLPFTDATSNVETYGGGRYLDIELQDDGTAVVDFNLSFNPFCVYNDQDFNCAIPPASNRLTFRMPAGEKKALLLED
jgi:uncharacterized protein (DUF1684 family)